MLAGRLPEHPDVAGAFEGGKNSNRRVGSGSAVIRDAKSAWSRSLSGTASGWSMVCVSGPSQRGGQLHERQWVSPSQVEHPLAGPGAAGGGPVVDQLLGCLAGERSDELLGQPSPVEEALAAGSVTTCHTDRVAGHPPGDESKHYCAGTVDPLDIVNQ